MQESLNHKHIQGMGYQRTGTINDFFGQPAREFVKELK
jgi:hypothetical protein